MKSKRTNSLIYRLKDDLGRWVDSPTEIKGLLLNVLQDRFKSTFLPTHNIDLSFIQTIMSQQESASLLLPFSNEEIRVVFFDMNLHKAPGIDCYRAHLFQAYWSTIETDIRLAIKGFFHHEKLMPFLNHTILALLPKIQNPDNPNHFRPISLINTVDKSISKLLVQRLCPILNQNRSPLQNAFTPERSSHDNIFIVQEIMNIFQKSSSKTGWCALKLNMEKAYE